MLPEGKNFTAVNFKKSRREFVRQADPDRGRSSSRWCCCDDEEEEERVVTTIQDRVVDQDIKLQWHQTERDYQLHRSLHRRDESVNYRRRKNPRNVSNWEIES